jgi:hypothetical protein
MKEMATELELYKTKLEKHWTLEAKYKKASELAEKRQKIMRKLEKDCIKYKTMYDEKVREYDTAKLDVSRLNQELVLREKRTNLVESNIRIGINLKK